MIFPSQCITLWVAVTCFFGFFVIPYINRGQTCKELAWLIFHFRFGFINIYFAWMFLQCLRCNVNVVAFFLCRYGKHFSSWLTVIFATSFFLTASDVRHVATNFTSTAVARSLQCVWTWTQWANGELRKCSKSSMRAIFLPVWVKGSFLLRSTPTAPVSMDGVMILTQSRHTIFFRSLKPHFNVFFNLFSSHNCFRGTAKFINTKNIYAD